MFKTKPRTLYKAGWVKVDGEEKCVIDSNSLVADRIEKWENLRRANASALPSFEEEESEGGEEFTSGIAGEEIDALFDDGEGTSNVIKAGEVAGPSLEEIEEEAQAIIEEAKAEAGRILEEARSQSMSMRADAVEEGTRQGFDEGYRKGMAEADGLKQELAERRRALEAEYDEMLENLEPRFIETITDVYSHIFGVDLMDNRDILVHLIDSTLRKEIGRASCRERVS